MNTLYVPPRISALEDDNVIFRRYMGNLHVTKYASDCLPTFDGSTCLLFIFLANISHLPLIHKIKPQFTKSQARAYVSYY